MYASISRSPILWPVLRLPVVLAAVALTGCSVCNVAQVGSGTWAFEGIVSRVFTEDVQIPTASKFRYVLDFEYQQPNVATEAGVGRYAYRSAYLDVSDDDGTVFQVQDLNGLLELVNGDGKDTLRVSSTKESEISGGLPGHAAATSMSMALVSEYEPLDGGPLGSGVSSTLPVHLDVHEFDPGLLRVEFGYQGRFIEGEVRTFECG